ncbi:MAG: PAS domain-containing protein [Beijerinckiaceae bacterium]
MKQAATIELFSYWDALRAGLDRVFLDAAPENMRALLANTFLVEADVRRAYPLRVVGGTLTRLTARARLGASFLECWEAGSQPLLESMLRVVQDERLPVVIGARTPSRGQTSLAIEVLLLPLAPEPGGKPRILGGPAPFGPLHRRAGLAPLELVSARALRRPLAQPGFAGAGRTDPWRGVPATPAAAQAHGRLRVIDGGKGKNTQV